MEFGKDIEKISKKFAILKNEIEQAGKLGLLNINRHCENFIKPILEYIHGYKLNNLNEETMNYPGLDLGSIEEGVAYQITSENDNSKINDTLATVMRHCAHKKFPKIIFILLSNKKTSYNIKSLSESGFNFSAKTDILDFNDILKQISFLDAETIALIREFVEKQLSYTITELQEKETFQEAVNKTLINVKDDLSISKLTYYEHFAITLNLYGSNFSVPTIFSGLNQVLNTGLKKSYLEIFSRKLQKPGITPKEINFELPLQDTGDINYFKHHMFSIKPNSIRFEVNYYSKRQEFIGDTNFQVGGLLTLIIALKQVYKNSPFQLEVNIDHTTNGEVYFYSNNNICQVVHTMSTYYLTSLNSFAMMIKSIENDELMNLIQEILNGYVVQQSAVPFENPNPFLLIEENHQRHAIQALKNILNPTLGELEK